MPVVFSAAFLLVFATGVVCFGSGRLEPSLRNWDVLVD